MKGQYTFFVLKMKKTWYHSGVFAPFTPRLLSRLGLAAYFLLTTAVIFILLPEWGNDDPFITYRYAENIFAGRGFVYNPDEHMLSTTAPLFALLLAVARVFTDNLPRAANLIGAASLAGGAVFLWDVVRQWKEPRAGWAALALYPTFGLLVRTLGSETPLYLAMCLGAISFYLRGKYTPTGLLLALAFLTRGDAVVLGGVLGVDWLVKNWPRTRGAWRGFFRRLPWGGLAAGGAVLLAWSAFAVPYFGSPLPVTLAVKRAQGLMAISEKFAPGFWTTLQPYLRQPYFVGEVALMAVGGGAAFWRKQWLLLVGWSVLYFLAYTLLGVTRYFWYYAPLVPGMVGLIGLGLAMGQRFPARFRGGTRIVTGVGIVFLAVLAIMQVSRLLVLRQNPDQRLVAYRVVGEWLAQNTPSDARVGALEVGVIGYYAVPRPMVDFAGLIQPEVAHLFAPEVTYQDTAQWAIAMYQPEWIVWHEGFSPELQATFLVENCSLAQRFPGTDTGYTDLSIYQCAYP
jgi:hypothetical protein